MPIWVQSFPVHSSPDLLQWPSCEPRSWSKTGGKQNFHSITKCWRCDLMFESSRGQHNCIPHCISLSSIILLLLMFCVFKDNINKEYNIYSSCSVHLCVMVLKNFTPAPVHTFIISLKYFNWLCFTISSRLQLSLLPVHIFLSLFPYLLKFPLISFDPALFV